MGKRAKTRASTSLRLRATKYACTVLPLATPAAYRVQGSYRDRDGDADNRRYTTAGAADMMSIDRYESDSISQDNARGLAVG